MERWKLHPTHFQERLQSPIRQSISLLHRMNTAICLLLLATLHLVCIVARPIDSSTKTLKHEKPEYEHEHETHSQKQRRQMDDDTEQASSGEQDMQTEEANDTAGSQGGCMSLREKFRQLHTRHELLTTQANFYPYFVASEIYDLLGLSLRRKRDDAIDERRQQNCAAIVDGLHTDVNNTNRGRCRTVYSCEYREDTFPHYFVTATCPQPSSNPGASCPSCQSCQPRTVSAKYLIRKDCPGTSGYTWDVKPEQVTVSCHCSSISFD